MKVTTEPYYFEIDVSNINKSIPEENLEDFNDWLKDQAYLGCGKQCEFYNIDDIDENRKYNPENEILVTFNITRHLYKIEK